MSWVYLMMAGVLEVAFTTAIRYTDGFTRPLPILLVLSLAALSFACVAKSTASIPLGTAYAVGGGLGVIGTASVGILLQRARRRGADDLSDASRDVDRRLKAFRRLSRSGTFRTLGLRCSPRG